MHIASIGMDLGKTTFHLVALGEQNKVLVHKKFSRAQLLAYTAMSGAMVSIRVICAQADTRSLFKGPQSKIASTPVCRCATQGRAPLG